MSERLTDEELDEAFAYAHGSLRLTAALSELRARRRSQDLSQEDREALAFAKERVSFNLNASAASEYFSDACADRHREAIAVLDRLLGGGK